MDDVRVFIAIDLPRLIINQLAAIQEQLSTRLPSNSVRWVKPGNIHLTLRFLGDVEQQKLSDIASSLDELVHGTSRFKLDLGSLGCFPNPRKPRIIWVGVDGETEELLNVYLGLEKTLDQLGWPPESRRYHPHLTLGRTKDVRQVIGGRLPWGTNIADGQFAAAALHLVRSDLLPTGAEYTFLHSALFTG